jgi:hypothetical protein
MTKFRSFVSTLNSDTKAKVSFGIYDIAANRAPKNINSENTLALNGHPGIYVNLGPNTDKNQIVFKSDVFEDDKIDLAKLINENFIMESSTKAKDGEKVNNFAYIHGY